MNPIMQGLSITVCRSGNTFLALGIFILVMTILQKIFPGGKEAQQEVKPVEAGEHPVHAGEAAAEAGDGEYPSCNRCRCQLFPWHGINPAWGHRWKKGKSGWWTTNRMTAQQGLGIRIKRSGK